MMSLRVLLALLLGVCSTMSLDQLLQDYQSDFGASVDTASSISSGSLEIEDPSYGAPKGAKPAPWATSHPILEPVLELQLDVNLKIQPSQPRRLHPKQRAPSTAVLAEQKPDEPAKDTVVLDTTPNPQLAQSTTPITNEPAKQLEPPSAQKALAEEAQPKPRLTNVQTLDMAAVLTPKQTPPHTTGTKLSSSDGPVEAVLYTRPQKGLSFSSAEETSEDAQQPSGGSESSGSFLTRAVAGRSAIAQPANVPAPKPGNKPVTQKVKIRKGSRRKGKKSRRRRRSSSSSSSSASSFSSSGSDSRDTYRSRHKNEYMRCIRSIPKQVSDVKRRKARRSK